MIKDRVMQFLEKKGIAKEKFFKNIGITSSNFRGKAKETPLNSTTIANILSEIPDINIEWLLTGKGEMLKREAPSVPAMDKNALEMIRELSAENALLRKDYEALKREKEELKKEKKTKEADWAVFDAK